MDTVDLFAGPGGWDVAAKERGMNVIGIEWDADACATRRAAGLHTVQGDVRHYGPLDWPDARNLIGSPPCQTFSAAGNGAGRRALAVVRHFAMRMAARDRAVRDELTDMLDERTGLVLEPLRWALAAIDAGHPYESIVLEQVPTVLPVWETFAAILRAEGYHVVTGRLSAEEYGVPQTRKRAVLVASWYGMARLPEPTHRAYRKGVPQSEGDPSLFPWVSMAEALGWGMTDRPALTVAVGTASGGADTSCVGGSGARKTLRGEMEAGRWIYRPETSGAALTDAVRVLPGDAAALQSFPPRYPWRGRKTAVYQQIGNAVPPRLASAILTANFREHPTRKGL